MKFDHPKLDRSRSAIVLNSDNIKNKKSEKDHVHTFYSRSWRIHSEFQTNGPDPKAPMDNTQPLFYSVGKQKPETFIFHPDWV